MNSKLSVRGIVYCALFAAIYVVLGYVTVPVGFSPVPITLQNFTLMVMAALLGPMYAFFSIMLVLVLAALGIPLLHNHGGIAYLLGPTGGFLFAYPFAVLLMGFFAPRIKGSGLGSALLLFLTFELFGSLLLYVTGVPWLAYKAHFTLSKALVSGCYPYLPGDAVKAVIAAIIVPSLRRVTGLSLGGSSRGPVAQQVK